MAGGAEIPAVGIDLGTTYSCVGYWRNGRVEIIPNEQGNRVTASYVAFTAKERLVGDAALDQVALNPVNTIFDAKRLIGRRFSDESVQNDMKLWPFTVIAGTHDRATIAITYKGKKMEFAPEQISSMVLMKMKETAEKYIGSEVKNAVVTVPAYFNQSQRQATMDAGKLAGLNVMRIINEPTAAAIAYGFENSVSFTEKKNVLVFDLGGGTFDVSILAIENGNFEVKATAGDGHLGGEDFDNKLVDHCIKVFNMKHGKTLNRKRTKDLSKKDITMNPTAIRKLRTHCEKAKRTLSSASEATIVIDGLFERIDFCETLSRSKFEELNLDLFAKCNETVERCLSDAKLSKAEIDHVVLVGGSSRIPKVQQSLSEFFNGKDLSRSIHQDEAVAYGAAIQAAYLSGHGNEKVRSLLLKDVTSLSLGVNTKGDIMNVLIPRNTPIPARKVEGFVTSQDNQSILSFKVMEGERAVATDNHTLGELQLTGLRRAPKGEVKVDVCFDMQAGGILTVSAKDRATGQETSITVASGRLPGEQIEKMVEDAKRLKEEDEKYIEKYRAKVAFTDHVYELMDDVKKKKQKIKTVVQWLEDQDEELAEARVYEEMKEELAGFLKN